MAVNIPRPVNEEDCAKIKIRVGGDLATKPVLQVMCDGRQLWGVRRVVIDEAVQDAVVVKLELYLERDTIEIDPEAKA